MGNKCLYVKAARIAANVEHSVANRVVGKIPAGSIEPAEALRAMTPVGNKVILEVLIAKNNTMESVAVPLQGFSRFNSCIALIPKGVAAFPKPSRLADIFSIMAPMAG